MKRTFDQISKDNFENTSSRSTAQEQEQKQGQDSIVQDSSRETKKVKTEESLHDSRKFTETEQLNKGEKSGLESLFKNEDEKETTDTDTNLASKEAERSGDGDNSNTSPRDDSSESSGFWGNFNAKGERVETASDAEEQLSPAESRAKQHNREFGPSNTSQSQVTDQESSSSNAFQSQVTDQQPSVSNTFQDSHPDTASVSSDTSHGPSKALQDMIDSFTNYFKNKTTVDQATIDQGKTILKQEEDTVVEKKQLYDKMNVDHAHAGDTDDHETEDKLGEALDKLLPDLETRQEMIDKGWELIELLQSLLG